MSSRDDAARAVRRAVDATRLSRAAFAQKAKVDVGTLNDFLDGRRWAQAPTRAKIEDALGWPAGRIADLVDGVGTMYLAVSGVEAAIEADETLHPAAKAHLLNQLDLLRLLPADAEIPSGDQARRRREALKAAMDARLDEVTDAEAPTPITRRKPRRKD